MLEAVTTDLVFTISLKRSTQNLQLSTSWPADYPIYRINSGQTAPSGLTGSAAFDPPATLGRRQNGQLIRDTSAANALRPIEKKPSASGLHDFAVGGKDRPGHPLGVPPYAARSGHCRIVEATTGEARYVGQAAGLPEQIRAAFGAEMPCMRSELTGFDQTNGQRTLNFSDLVVEEVGDKLNGAPVRRRQSSQLHRALRTGSPSTSTEHSPQEHREVRTMISLLEALGPACLSRCGPQPKHLALAGQDAVKHASRFRRKSAIGKSGRDSGHRVSVAIDPSLPIGSEFCCDAQPISQW
jgi:hypothetical protein